MLAIPSGKGARVVGYRKQTLGGRCLYAGAVYIKRGPGGSRQAFMFGAIVVRAHRVLVVKRKVYLDRFRRMERGERADSIEAWTTSSISDSRSSETLQQTYTNK